VLEDEKGWRAYPPTQTSTPEGESGLRGSKTFEFAVIPETKQTYMPVFEFSYFDPTAAKYVTLRTPPQPLEVEGVIALPPAPAPSAAGQAPAPAPAPPPPPAPTDILGLRYDFGSPASLTPLYRSRIFLQAQLVPLVLLILWLLLRLRRPSAAARELGVWRRERAALLAQLRRERERQAFFETAARLLQYEGALQTGAPPEVIDSAALQRLFPDEPVVVEVFEQRAALLFAGQAGQEKLEGFDRDRILATVTKLSRA
jgi:hypothetical protein